MARYKNTSFGHTLGKHHFKTTLYASVPVRNDDIYLIAQEGDRCDNIANRFYGNPNHWWFIARVNGLKTMNIPAGTSLRLPRTLDKAKGF